ncbi:ROK family transcriptional regulator [Clavibacter capsici]|uniref:ROK family transcriptional regulator n=1 Tax=Clavibacter capsici TaxID=1874630 RepID=UPI00158120A2|nr:ROK family transcriptional regulator [Clavibacter capsici]
MTGHETDDAERASLAPVAEPARPARAVPLAPDPRSREIPPPGDARSRGTTPDHVRRSNLATVLQIVHETGPASRSELTRETGLNRSTIAALVGELQELGLVVESEPPGTNRVGRPSPIVSADPRVVVFAVNPEIDAVTVGLVGLDGVVQERVRRDTDGIPTAAVAAEVASGIVAELRADLRATRPDARVLGIGVAVPGLVRFDGGLVRLAPHLGWVDEPFAALLAEATGLPALAANDASLAAVAEGRFGSGRDVDDLVYLNGGASGVGGGVLIGRRPFGGAEGYGGELGHTLVDSGGELCHCGAVGCLETTVGQDALLEVTGLPRARADELGDVLAAALEAGDARVTREVERQIDNLAVALRNVVNIFNPSLVVLGGFLGSLHAADPDRILARATAQALPGAREALRIRRAALGPDRLMIGAAELAFARVLVDPSGVMRAAAEAERTTA